jgi:hypothetical protein
MDAVEESWRAVDSVLNDAAPVSTYEPGSWGRRRRRESRRTGLGESDYSINLVMSHAPTDIRRDST